MDIKNIEILDRQATRKINYAEDYSVFKPPVFVYKIPSIRSWNIFIKKTLTSTQSVSVRVMEYIPELSCILVGFENGLVLGYSIHIDIFNDFYRDTSHSSAVTHICYVNDENTFFTAGLDNKIIVHNLKHKISSVFLDLPSNIIKLTSIMDREYLVFATSSEVQKINFQKILNGNNKLENLEYSKISGNVTSFFPKNLDLSHIINISNLFYFNTSFYHFVVLVYEENKLYMSNMSQNEVINLDYGMESELVFENLVVRDISLIEIMPFNLLLVLTNDKNTKETFILKFYIHVENLSSNITIRYQEKLDFINISSANKMVYCYDGKSMIIYSDDHESDSFILLNLQSGIKKQINIKSPEKLKSLAYINDHTNILATGMDNGNIEIWTYLK
jgi:hypothetical protein